MCFFKQHLCSSPGFIYFLIHLTILETRWVGTYLTGWIIGTKMNSNFYATKNVHLVRKRQDN